MNLMRIVVKAKDIMSAKLPGGKKASATVVQEWLSTNVKWGVRTCPDASTVEKALDMALTQNTKLTSRQALAAYCVNGSLE